LLLLLCHTTTLLVKMGVPMASIEGAECVYIPQWAGMPEDQLAATIANIIIAIVGVLSLLYYGAHSYLSICGWEEVYVCVVERKFHSRDTECMHNIMSSSTGVASSSSMTGGGECMRM
jgi:hypothetical protein